MTETVDQVRDALAIAEQQYAAAVAAHGAVLERLAEVETRLFRAATGRRPQLVEQGAAPVLLRMDSDLPSDAYGQWVLRDQLVKQEFAANKEAQRLEKIVQGLAAA
jgi:hypothetical protein